MNFPAIITKAERLIAESSRSFGTVEDHEWAEFCRAHLPEIIGGLREDGGLVDQFIQHLNAELNRLGIDTSSCDGEEAPHIIIAGWIAGRIKNAEEDRDASQARCGALERAAQDERRMDWIIDNCTISGGGNGFELRVFIHVDSECIRDAIDRIICADNADHERRPDSVSPIPVVKESSSATLTPSQQPDNLEGGDEPCAQKQTESLKTTIPLTQSEDVNEKTRGGASNPQPESPIPSGVGQPSRLEPVKAGEWLPMESAPRWEDVLVAVKSSEYPEIKQAVSSQGTLGVWSFEWDRRFENGSYCEAIGWQPLPAPPIAPEGKATEGEG